MVKHDNEWGTVCDDSFTQTSAQAACHTLGLGGGTFSYREKITGDRHDSRRFGWIMSNVQAIQLIS